MRRVPVPALVPSSPNARVKETQTKLEVLLVKRGLPPKAGFWALPGGKVDPNVDKTLGGTAVREMLEETGLLVQIHPEPYYSQVAAGVYQLHHFWAERLVDASPMNAVAKSDASHVAWFDVADILAKAQFASPAVDQSDSVLFVDELHAVLSQATNLLSAGRLRLL